MPTKSTISCKCRQLYSWSMWGVQTIMENAKRCSFRLATLVPSRPIRTGQCFACQVSKHTERETSGLPVESLARHPLGETPHHELFSLPSGDNGEKKQSFHGPGKTAGKGGIRMPRNKPSRIPSLYIKYALKMNSPVQ